MSSIISAITMCSVLQWLGFFLRAPHIAAKMITASPVARPAPSRRRSTWGGAGGPNVGPNESILF